MPIYEYLCGACGHVLDALQKHSDEPLVHCPHCGEPQLKRQLSAPSFRLKGGGWYETDFKSDKRRNIAESDSTAGGGKAKESPDGCQARRGQDGQACRRQTGLRQGRRRCLNTCAACWSRG
ncbi:MAG TPA: zinc ribbon domain-containing protein [Gammaproteobacteria bacterium]|nr:zinc ribbon domain-containing protein [Gammaproteobacteria bacterium]